MNESVTVTDGRPAPLEGCDCTVCRWAERQIRLDEDLAANYARYRAGRLVSLPDRE